MIYCRQRDDGLIEIDLSCFKDLVSCTVRYRIDDEKILPASVYRSLSPDYMIDEADVRYWNYGISRGQVRFRSNEKNCIVYWNRYINLKSYTGPVEIFFDILTEEGTSHESVKTIINKGREVYLDKWSLYAGENGTSDDGNCKDKWLIKKDRFDIEYITAGSGQELPVMGILPEVEGLYDVYICLRSGTARLHIGAGDEGRRKFMPGGGVHELYEQDFCDKEYKEIMWETVNFKKDSVIRISQIVNNNYILDFGSISYIKLVPHNGGKQEAEIRGKNGSGNLNLYFEPYSCAACFGMVTPRDVYETIDNFLRLKPDEITCQVGRVGSKVVYHSSTIDRVDMACITDDLKVCSGQTLMVRNMDVLRVASSYCRKKGIFFTANLGVNRPYLSITELTDRFVFDNMDKIKDGLLDYECPEVMDYALRMVREIVDNYDIDGFSLDFMRTEDNQTRDTLVELAGRVREILDQKENGRTGPLRFTVRIPSDREEYYEAAVEWVKNGLVDVIIPSYATEMVPVPRIEHYVRLCRGTGTKVYGCVDGWRKFALLEQEFGNVEFAMSPKDIRDAVTYYKSCGAQGVFVYQGENYAFNPLVTADLLR